MFLCFIRTSQPHVNIWDSVSLNTLHILGLGGDFDRSIACLAFSRLDGGALLCVIDEGHDHGISVWEWQKSERGVKIIETKVGANLKSRKVLFLFGSSNHFFLLDLKSSSDPVLALEFHPMDRSSFISCGKGHVNFWTLEGTTLLKSSGIFDVRINFLFFPTVLFPSLWTPFYSHFMLTFFIQKNKPKYVHCMAFTEMGDLVTGDSNGNILLWDRGQSTQFCNYPCFQNYF